MTPILAPVTKETLDPECYLAANADLQRVAAPLPSARKRHRFARRHYADHGHGEGRLQFVRAALEAIEPQREHKLARLRERSPQLDQLTTLHRFDHLGIPMTVRRSSRASDLPWPMENISANVYDGGVEELLATGDDLLFVDLGAGLRREYRSNVVNVEVDCLPTTDLLALGDALPVEDETFDGGICLAVLEHVRDPFAVATELMRVIKPGGHVIVDWPFLQPVHGYPDHYFNATMNGAEEAFRRIPTVADVETWVPLHFHPVFSATWMLQTWLDGLDEAVREEFAALTIGEFAARSPHEWVLDTSWVSALPAEAQQVISAGTRLRITRS